MNMKNKILYTSWGYDMTHVDYAKIIRETPKKVECVMIGSRVENDNGQGNGKAYPDETIVKSAPFMLCKKQWKGGEDYYKGSYPFCGESKRMDTFMVHKDGGHYYNTWD